MLINIIISILKSKLKMYARLKDKIFYFVTDKDTNFTYFVDNTNGKA